MGEDDAFNLRNIDLQYLVRSASFGVHVIRLALSTLSLRSRGLPRGDDQLQLAGQTHTDIRARVTELGVTCTFETYGGDGKRMGC